MDEEPDDYPPTRSKSSSDFRRDSGDDREAPPFVGSTLQPLSTHNPWNLGVFPPSNASLIPPRERFIEAEVPSTTDSPPAAPFHADYSNEEYGKDDSSLVRTDAESVTRGATVDQPEARYILHSHP